MMSSHLDQDLPDEVRGAGTAALRVWEPQELRVVLGRSDRPEEEVKIDACRKDGVPVERRMGGGGTVLLSPGCLVVSLAVPVPAGVLLGSHMERAVELLGRIVSEVSGVPLTPRGTGDLCAGERKVLGSSALRGRGVFFYQASLLVDVDMKLIHRYLKHPTREPSYRRGRLHRDFLTTLRTQGCRLAPADLGPAVEIVLRGRIGGIAEDAATP